MTIDMSNNRVPYGLLTAEETAALHEHEQAGGVFEFTDFEKWKLVSKPTWNSYAVYRTVPLPKTQDIIAWERLPAWVEWVARGAHGAVFGYGKEPNLCGAGSSIVRIDDFPGIVVQIGTVDWQDSKQRRPK
jgi:hypothetical protein